MNHLQRVLWTEGMFLGPQHFQQWDRHRDHLLWGHVELVSPWAWGFAELRIDEEALKGGELAIQRASGVMPDGCLFQMPDVEAVPARRPLATAFDPKSDRLGAWLALPAALAGAPACSPDGVAEGRPTRFRQRAARASDENPGGMERDITCAVPNLKVIFDGEPTEDLVVLKLADIVRTTAGAFALAPDHIPPLVRVGASAVMAGLVRKHLEMLSARSEELASKRRQRGSGLVEFTMSEAASFWFLHTLNSAIPAFVHLHQSPNLHPERAYRELIGLIGQLSTFSSAGTARQIPPYAHDDLGATFARLEERLRGLLDTIIPSKCAPIPLEKTGEMIYTARIMDERALEECQLYLAVHSSSPEEKVIKEVPLKAKVSSLDRVDRLIARAMRGLNLRHMIAPPSEIPTQPGRVYFQVEKIGEHWDAVRGARTLSFYLGPEFTELRLELMAVKG